MSQAGETSSFVTRSGLRARSGTPTPVSRPTPVRHRPARAQGSISRATPVYDDGSDDKPTIITKNSKAYGAATKVAAPKQMDTRQALRPAAEALDAAVANTTKPTSALIDHPEESSREDEDDEEVESEEMENTVSSKRAHDRFQSRSIRQAAQTQHVSSRAQTTHAWLENTFWAPHAPSLLTLWLCYG